MCTLEVARHVAALPACRRWSCKSPGRPRATARQVAHRETLPATPTAPKNHGRHGKTLPFPATRQTQ